MASTTGDREIKLLKADGRQFVRRKDKLQDGSSKTGTKSDEQTIATSLLPEGTKAVEPNNATSPHEVAVPSLDRLDLNENSDGAIEDLSESAWLRDFLDREGKRRRTMKWKRLPPPDMLVIFYFWVPGICLGMCVLLVSLRTGFHELQKCAPYADFSSLLEGLIDPPGVAV